MASLRTFGMEIWLDAATETDAPEGTYRLCDNNVKNPSRQTGEGDMFTDDGNSTWVDHGTQGNYSWSYEVVDGCVRLQNAALIADKSEYEGMYLGFDGTYVTADNTANSGDHRDAYTAILRHVDPSVAGVSVDWKLVDVYSYEEFAESDAYQAYADGAKQYIASIGLKKAIEDAEALWIDVTSAVAIYTNTSSSVDEMANATKTLNELVDAKKRLQSTIEDYKAKGFDGTAPYEAILKDLSATKAQVEQAITDLNAAYVEWAKTQASVENPIDVSSKIVNPTFDNGNTSNGWSGDAFGRGGTVADGAEHYSKNYDTYQKVFGLSAGVYAVGVNGFYRAGNYGGTAEGHWVAQDAASKNAKFYATVGETTREVAVANVLSGAQATNQGAGDIEVTYTDAEENQVTVYAPNTMATGDYFFHTLNQYANKLFVAVDETGELTIGVKKSSLIDGDWSLFDDFSLTYFGNGADACNLYLQESLKNYGEYVIDDNTLYTKSYLEAYQAAYSNTSVTASTLAEVNAILKGIDDAKAALDKNIELWKKYQKLLSEAENIRNNDEYDGIEEWDELCDYLFEDVEDILDEVKLTNEELEAEMAKITSWMETIEYKSKALVYEGKDMTKYVKNPGFDDDENIDYGGAEGWTIDRISGGNVVRGPLGQSNQDVMVRALGEQNFCFESWHCHKWDIWQEVKNLPVGIYELQVQGYVRCEVPGYTQGEELGDQYPSPVYLYMNNSLSSFPSVYSEQIAEEHYDADGNLPLVEGHSWNGAVPNYPNSMGGASICFAWDMYKKSAYGLVAKPGDSMRIGVKGDMNDNWWCIWDNFHLVYQGFKADVVEPALDEALLSLDLSQYMGKSVYAKAEALNKAAQEAKAAGDGRAMFDVLNDVYELSEEILTSVALFKKLWDAAETTLGEALDNSNAASSVKNEAAALQGRILSGIEDHEFEDAEVQGLLDEIDAMITKLGIPAGAENATDANPSDFTRTIPNPTYDENVNGWSGTGAAWGGETAQNAEIFNKDFDYYKELLGLYEGTYQVSVQGFYRYGSAENDYNTWIENPELNNNAFLYASVINGTDTVTFSKPLIRLAAEASSEEEYGEPGDGYVWAKASTGNGDGMVVCNSMTTGSYEFENGKYTNNVVTFKVNEGAKVRIGLKKNVNIDNNWTLWDNWGLTYFGKNSDKAVDGDASGIKSINDLPKLKVEFFTLDGRKATAVQKGIMIQKTTLDNGAVIIRKVRK